MPNSFDEEYCGYINSNTLRAGYPESKRCGEALCQAYKEEKKLDVVITRFTRTYGPTMLKNDSKAISQFILKALNNEDIVLTDDTTADDVEEWDSLSHVQLISAIEKKFNIRFTSKEILGWKNVGELINSIQKK